VGRLDGADRRGAGQPRHVREHRGCWNAHDVSRILEHYNDDVVWRNIATGEVFHGKAPIGEFLQELFDAVPDLVLEVTLRVPRGKYVAEEYHLRGHHRGNLFGIPATGRYVDIPCVSMVEMRDAKWKEDRFYYDVSTVLRQMGLFPSPTMARTRVGHLGMSVLVGLTRAGRRIRHPLGGGGTDESSATPS
jgi:steroid delta-isomerase-like uncharacterized protein